MSIEKITRVPLREVWRHEAHNFTTWLEENVDELNDVLDFNLASAEREQAAGDFSVDLVGQDEDGNTVVVENQLERSDHDHLGKVLTYLSALEAKAAVWVVAQARAEHVKAITWLNEATSTPFYLVKVEAIRIGDSAPAALFTRIVGPSEEARAVGAIRRGLSERNQLFRSFWELLLQEVKERGSIHRNISPTHHYWLGTSSGVRGLSWNYAVRQHTTMAELYIDRGEAEENRSVYDQLFAKREEVEAAFGDQLEWMPLETRRACRIRFVLERGGWKDESSWSEVVPSTVDAMDRLEGALREPVKALIAT